MYVVTAAYVTAQIETPDGKQIRGFLQGAVLPDSVPQESIDHLLDVNLIEKVGSKAALAKVEFGPTDPNETLPPPPEPAVQGAPAKPAAKGK